MKNRILNLKPIKKGLVIYVIAVLLIGSLWLGNAQDKTAEIHGEFSLLLNEEKSEGELHIKAVPNKDNISVVSITLPDGSVKLNDSAIFKVAENTELEFLVTTEERIFTETPAKPEVTEEPEIPNESKEAEEPSADEQKIETKEIQIETVKKTVKLKYKVAGLVEKEEIIPEPAPSIIPGSTPEITPSATPEQNPAITATPEAYPEVSVSPSSEMLPLEEPKLQSGSEGAVLSTFNGSEAWVDDNGSLILNDSNFSDSFLDTIMPNLITSDAVLNGVTVSGTKVISEYSAGLVKTIKISYIGECKGLEYFIELESFTALNCNFKTIDISKNLNLVTLNLSASRIETMDISKNVNLVTLELSSNKLSELDISHNIKLESLKVKDNQLKNLDTSLNRELTLLDIEKNQVTGLDLNQNQRLITLLCSANQLAIVDVSKNINLVTLRCNSNKITKLDTSKNTKLESLQLSNNKNIEMDVRQNVNLTYLDCQEVDLNYLDVTQNVKLERLWCNSNQLTSLDITKNRKLEVLDCDNNQLEHLDVTKNIYLEYIFCDGNKLTQLDVTQNINLINLFCRYNEITDLDLSKNMVMDVVHCDNNKLTNLDLSKNVNLAFLQCHNNQLATLDLSKAVSVVGVASTISKQDMRFSEVPVTQNEAGQWIADFKEYMTPEQAKRVSFQNAVLLADSTQFLLNDSVFPESLSYSYRTLSKDSDARIRTMEVINYKPVNNTLYQVSFVNTGETAIENQIIRAGSTVLKPSDPEKNNFTFEGWYQDEGLTLSWDFENDTVQSDTILYGKWKLKQYTVSFQDEETEYQKQILDYDSLVNKPKNPVKNNFTFEGWYKEPEFLNIWDFETERITQDTVLYGKWKIEAYTVLFMDGETEYQKLIVDFDSRFDKPEDPIKENYIFTGWYKEKELLTIWQFEKEAVNGDLTLYAGWKKQNIAPPDQEVIPPSDPGQDHNAINTAVKEGMDALGKAAVEIKKALEFIGLQSINAVWLVLIVILITVLGLFLLLKKKVSELMERMENCSRPH